MFKLFRVPIDIRDRMFIAKIYSFINPLESVSDEQKQKMYKKMKSNTDEANKIGEIILLTLDKVTDLAKPKIMFIIFLSYLDDNLNRADFIRILGAIDFAVIDDLNKFFNLHKLPEKSQEPYLRYLAPTGLTEVLAQNTFDELGELYYEVSILGQIALNAYRHGSELSSATNN